MLARSGWGRYRTAVRTLLAALALALACSSTACSGKEPAHPRADPERQSLAEYDVATDLWLRRGEPRQALDHALRAVDLDDENAEAHHLVALIYLRFCEIRERVGDRAPDACRLADAERHLRDAIEANGDYREARNTLAVVLLQQKRYRDAIGVLEPLTSDILYQTPEIAWGNLGWAYLETRQVDRALDALQRAVAAQPEFCVGWYRLGLAKLGKRDLTGADEAFTEAVSRDKRCAGLQVAYLKRGSVREKLGLAEEARDDFERCVELDRSTRDGKECAVRLTKLKYSRGPRWNRSDSTFASSAKRNE